MTTATRITQIKTHLAEIDCALAMPTLDSRSRPILEKAREVWTTQIATLNQADPKSVAVQFDIPGPDRAFLVMDRPVDGQAKFDVVMADGSKIAWGTAKDLSGQNVLMSICWASIGNRPPRLASRAARDAFDAWKQITA